MVPRTKLTEPRSARVAAQHDAAPDGRVNMSDRCWAPTLSIDVEGPFWERTRTGHITVAKSPYHQLSAKALIRRILRVVWLIDPDMSRSRQTDGKRSNRRTGFLAAVFRGLGTGNALVVTRGRCRRRNESI
jgi:hypothetical protein